MTDHDCEPLDPCPVCEADKAAYAQGRADERAAIVRWLRDRGHVNIWESADRIEDGEHARLKPTNANRCPHCKRYFTTPHGLGLHFTWTRKKTGKPCSAAKEKP